MMRQLPRTLLTTLVQQEGKAVIENPLRLEGILRDRCPGCQRETVVLVAALRQHVCEDLMSRAEGVPLDRHLHQLADRLYETMGIAPECALWGVVSWAIALNLLPQDTRVGDGEAEGRVHPSAHQRPEGTADRSSPPAYASLVVSQDGSGQFHTLTDAVAAAQPHTAIYVKPGTYQETVEIKKSLLLIGEGTRGTVIVGGRASSCLTVKGGPCAVHGITFVQPPAAEPVGGAVEIHRGTAVIEDCDIHGSWAGIAVRGGRMDLLVQRCSIAGTGLAAVYVEKGRGRFEECTFAGSSRGLLVHGKSDILFRKCQVTKSSVGLEFGKGGTGTLENCQILDNTYANVLIHDGGTPFLKACTIHGGESGVEVGDRGKGTLEECRIQRGVQGILISQKGNPKVYRCTIDYNRFGFRITASGKGSMEECDISENEFAGISIKEGGNPSVKKCRIHDNGDVGIWVHKSGLGTFEDNDLRGNRKGAFHIEEGSRVRQKGNLV